MGKRFNVAGACDPQFHYMVDLQSRLAEIKKMVDAGAYFTINHLRKENDAGVFCCTFVRSLMGGEIIILRLKHAMPAGWI